MTLEDDSYSKKTSGRLTTEDEARPMAAAEADCSVGLDPARRFEARGDSCDLHLATDPGRPGAAMVAI